MYWDDIPLTYFNIVKKSLNQFYEGRPLTMLDIGSNNGSLITKINRERHFRVTGIEIFSKNAEAAMRTGFYEKVIVGDILKYKFDEKFDIVFCSDLIEHLSKADGLVLLDKVEKIARKAIIFNTAKGYQVQSTKRLKANPHEAHISGWEPYEFTMRGYKVIYVTSKPVFYFREFLEKNKLAGVVASALSVILQPITYKFSSLALYMVCYKRK